MVCEAERIASVQSLLRAEGYDFEPEPFSSHCYKLLHEPRPLGASLAAFFGYIYIQNRSSMLPPLALDPAKGCAVLDVCASPGGKSGFLAQLTGPTGFVLANEPTPARLGTLRANLRACNLLQTATCAYHGGKLPLPPRPWQAILLDPPCSGWGTAEKHPRVLKIWRGDKIQNLIALQRQLLRRAADMLAPGGRLVYSTCTTNEAENEAQTRFAREELGLECEDMPPFPGFVWEQGRGGVGMLRVDGKKSLAQGFFLARLRKPGNAVKDGREDGMREGGGLQRQERPLTAAALAGPCCDPALLPPGHAAIYGGHVRFIPALAGACIPPGFVWQAALLGRLVRKNSGEIFSPAPRLRVLPPPVAGRSVVLDDVREVAALLCGQRVRAPLESGEAGLWWRDLPLGCVSVRQGRVVAAFR
ncbi:MAG: RsmB/NOP family class I SAM-dependent RNA methyltransferase [Desulfovibrio sp.]|jgi:16S rRNA (cytosine1407-C5)-methyltransferase|nr:RsmB/NOP family class I SAM-dependent RNA methyltransferase [Desulfovibrio sp.]